VIPLLSPDHTIPYLSPNKGGPPGHTRIGNLGPYVRRHHNYKTNGDWQVRQPEPGTWLWRSPRRRVYLVNASGTHPLGDSEFAQKMWRAARSPQQQVCQIAFPSGRRPGHADGYRPRRPIGLPSASASTHTRASRAT
jgi:hypothetical protein